jgi:hypothetical protein
MSENNEEANSEYTAVIHSVKHDIWAKKQY